jgi:hypothetical protein
VAMTVAVLCKIIVEHDHHNHLHHLQEDREVLLETITDSFGLDLRKIPDPYDIGEKKGLGYLWSVLVVICCFIDRLYSVGGCILLLVNKKGLRWRRGRPRGEQVPAAQPRTSSRQLWPSRPIISSAAGGPTEPES